MSFEGFGDYTNTTGVSLTIVNGNSARCQTGLHCETQVGETNLVLNGNLNSLLRGSEWSQIEGSRFSTTVGASFSTVAGVNLAFRAGGMFETVIPSRLTLFASRNITIKKGAQYVSNMGPIFSFHSADAFVWTDNSSDFSEEKRDFGEDFDACFRVLREDIQRVKTFVLSDFRSRWVDRLQRIRGQNAYEVSGMNMQAAVVGFRVENYPYRAGHGMSGFKPVTTFEMRGGFIDAIGPYIVARGEVVVN